MNSTHKPDKTVIDYFLKIDLDVVIHEFFVEIVSFLIGLHVQLT